MNSTNAYTPLAEIRDQIEAVSTLAEAARRGAEHLDSDATDSLTDDVKTTVAEQIWAGLLTGISAIEHRSRPVRMSVGCEILAE